MSRLGVDTGGTFTDFALLAAGRLTSWKEPSTPDDPARAILAGLRRLADTGAKLPDAVLIHGSTVATNALLEGRTARIAFVTNRGFEDLLEIGRQARPDLYNLEAGRPAPLAPRDLRFGIAGRLGPDGRELEAPAGGEAAALASRLKELGVEAVALCLLHAWASAAHEERAARELSSSGLPVSVSSRLVPEHREYERASTCAVNAAVSPVVARYLERLRSGIEAGPGTAPSLVRVMGSNGGAMSLAAASREAVRTVLSGPAGGARAALWAGAAAGCAELISFDMGGTSTDVCLVPGVLRTTGEASVAGYPVRIPAVDIHTVGAGGGSIAWRDAGGALRVGPASGGADPGPACYGRGGPATVTDANVALGRMVAERFLDGRMPLDVKASRRALSDLGASLGLSPEAAAEGILEVAEETMARAIRVISLHRGHDPADFVLVAFGGAGGLHAAALAESLGMTRALVPSEPGVLSALGMTVADVLRDRSATLLREADQVGVEDLERLFSSLERACAADLREDGFESARIVLRRALDLRYRGQSYELTISAQDGNGSWAAAFHEAHRRRFGYSRPSHPVEVVTLRVQGAGIVEAPGSLPLDPAGRSLEAARVGRAPLRWRGRDVEAAVYERGRLPARALPPGSFQADDLRGPALVLEAGATTFVPPGWAAALDAAGHLRMAGGASGAR